jgi:aldose 1-epimerase
MRCVLAPELGGAIAALTHNCRPVLRSATGLDDVLQTACFPLVPFANRIAEGRFTFGGRSAQLAIDPEGAPHALHGHGWRRIWETEQVGRHGAVLRMDFPGGDWPWPYRAWQRFELQADALLVELTIENRDPTGVMPAGLGLHPYFPRSSQTSMAATAAQMWCNDPTGLAQRLEPSALFIGDAISVEGLTGLDNFFPSPDPALVICDDTMIVTLAAQGAGFHLYCPSGLPFFCAEAVSHAPNSFGRAEMVGADLLAPRARRSQTYRFAVSRPLAMQDRPQLKG